MNANLGPNLSFYPNPAASFPLPFQSPSATAYNFGHALSGHHPGQYQHFFVTSQHHLNNPQPVRLSSEPPPFPQPIPEIRPARNAFNRGAKFPPSKTGYNPDTQPSPIHPSSNGSPAKSPASSEVEFSTEVDVLMKAIQSKPDSQPLPSLQRLSHVDRNGFPSTYPMSLPTNPPRCALAVDDQVSRSGKKRKYTCTLPRCGKRFAQKTHLDIHMRAHTGDKPFVCISAFDRPGMC